MNNVLCAIRAEAIQREPVATAFRRVRGWYEMVASLRGCDPGSRGTSAIESRYWAT
jgi:hypothetical protein